MVIFALTRSAEDCCHEECLLGIEFGGVTYLRIQRALFSVPEEVKTRSKV